MRLSGPTKGAPGRAHSGGSPPRATVARVPCGARAAAACSSRWPSSSPWRPRPPRSPAGSEARKAPRSRPTRRPGSSMPSAPPQDVRRHRPGKEGETTADVAREVKRVMADVPARAWDCAIATVDRAAWPRSSPAGRSSSSRGAAASSDHDRRTGRSLRATSLQRWPFAAGVHWFWTRGSAARRPTIAIVDSGIQAGRADFGARVARGREPHVPPAQLARRRPRPRHLRGWHRRGQRETATPAPRPVPRSSRSTSWTTRAWP